jgi:hypothetical protein
MELAVPLTVIRATPHFMQEKKLRLREGEMFCPR